MTKQRSNKDRLLTWLYIVILIFLVLFLFFNKYGLLKYFELKSEIQSIEFEIERSKNEIEELDKNYITENEFISSILDKLDMNFYDVLLSRNPYPELEKFNLTK